MDRELESLRLAFDAWLEASENDAARCQAVFESMLEVTSAGRPNLTKETLLKAARAYYPRLVRAQQRPPTLPPKA